MNIIGISAFYHESACCLVQKGRLVAAVAEERFTRIKHDPRLPVRAFRYCLEAAGLMPGDIDAIAYYEQPAKKAERQQWSPGGDAPPRQTSDHPIRLIRERLGFDGPVLTFDHHLSHAASAYYYSGFDEAAVLTVDGVGEWTTTAYGEGRGNRVALLEEVRFPHSLGLLYATLTAYLGFRINGGEGKVMGLAAYGEPRYLTRLRSLLQPMTGGQFRLDMRYFDFVRGTQMFSPLLCEWLGQPPRSPESEILPFHRDIASSLQHLLEETLMEMLQHLKRLVPVSSLCMAGGVALNGVANGRIRREGPFEQLFIQPAAGDAGGCVGAALLAHLQMGGSHQPEPLQQVYLGPQWSNAEVGTLLTEMGIAGINYQGKEAALLHEVATRLQADEVVGWFQGRMEFGPRALGARSILASPLSEGMQTRLNCLIKRREAFRPFAPAVLLAHASDHFDLSHPSPFMLETCRVISPLALPAITHVDGSARPQTVTHEANGRYARLLEAFYAISGCPILLNTSFNVRGEPIVCTPMDALLCSARAGLDAIVLEEWLVPISALPPAWAQLTEGWREPSPVHPETNGSPLGENLYPF